MTVTDPEAWGRESRMQLYLGDLLWQQFASLRSLPTKNQKQMEEEVASLAGAMLHWGYAIENAAKAALVSVDPNVAIDGKVKVHKLNDLVERSLGTQGAPVKDVLNRLTEYVVWAGKYQAPLFEKAFERAEKGKLQSVKHPTDREIIQELYDKLHAHGGTIASLSN